MGNSTKDDEAWKALFEKYPQIVKEIETSGLTRIKADVIKEFREPRLMAKHDSIEGVPRILKARGYNILAVSTKEYVLGSFDPFYTFPTSDSQDVSESLFSFPEFETLKIGDINSETKAINALQISGILNDFLDEEGSLTATFNGRIGSGSFQYQINRRNNRSFIINVDGAQIEIDGGFETSQSVVIVEAKNVIHDDFQVRQLYYPFHKYAQIVKNKPIRLVFSQYTNLTYRLYEFAFVRTQDFSSLECLQSRCYTITDKQVTARDIENIWRGTPPIVSDNMNAVSVPFIQADKFDRLTSICEFLLAHSDGASKEQVLDFMGTVDRQYSYYAAAGEYLELLERFTEGKLALTSLGRKIFTQHYRARQLGLVAQMFKHQVFHDLY